jgi:hypothetical protein
MKMAKIKQNDRGGYSIYIEGEKPFGNFATRFDAIRICLRNKIRWDALDA